MQSMDLVNQTVSTHVRYLADHWRGTDELPRIFDRDTRRTNTRKHEIIVRDARAVADTIKLDKNGFELYRFDSPVSDFEDSEAVTKVYQPAIAAFAKEVTGADEVFVTNHLIRTEDKSDFNKAYARFVHCDYGMDTARSASLNLVRNRKLNVAGYEDADFAWYNSWQPFDNPVLQNPLAMLDATTIHAGDIVDYVYGGNGKSLKSSMPVYRTEHQFFYYSNMTPTEVLLIKQLDSRAGRAHVAPHTSFDDANAPIDAPPRRSIEVRMMAVFR